MSAIGDIVKGAITGIAKPVTDVIGKNIERKAAKESLRVKERMARQDADYKLEFTDAEWEVAKANREDDSWKDEWITIVITAPIALIIIGSINAAITGNTAMVDGAVAGINTLNTAGIPMAHLMTATVYAGLSLKIWRNK